MFQISVVRWIEKKKGSNKKQRDTVALWETTMWHTVSNISYRTSWTKNSNFCKIVGRDENKIELFEISFLFWHLIFKDAFWKFDTLFRLP